MSEITRNPGSELGGKGGRIVNTDGSTAEMNTGHTERDLGRDLFYVAKNSTFFKDLLNSFLELNWAHFGNLKSHRERNNVKMLSIS